MALRDFFVRRRLRKRKRLPGADQPHEVATDEPAVFCATTELNGGVKAYSRRMMPPFTGQLQIAESSYGRALSIDGTQWEVQFRLTGGAFRTQSGQRGGGDSKGKYIAVATITPAGLKRHPLAHTINAEAVALTLDHLAAWIADAELPFPSSDRHELWLLDQQERNPLALLYSCTTADEISAPSARPTWMAMPAAQLPIGNSGDHDDTGLAPVNARLESLVADRAGPSPRAAWFNRDEPSSTPFPTCLIREDWEHEEQHQLCQRYIRRLAPRLLMLQELVQHDRERLEDASREHALDVDRFHKLYPEVIDEDRMLALRVEARLRRAARPD